MTTDAAKRLAQLGLPEETTYGFAQAVQVGPMIWVSGQVGRDGDERPADMAGQMRIAYRRLAQVLAQLGVTMRDVVDETLYVTDMRAASAAAREVRAEAYGLPIDVASTLIGVACIGSPDARVPALVEIKATAVDPRVRPADPAA
jgi:2-iminobutanoate/2-iminopropanoate deaminase